MRINYIDNMKALGIFFVVLGHAAWLDENLYILIYSFHMPLFFFLSGYLFFKKSLYKVEFLKIIQRLVIPFLFFFCISYLCWLPLSLFGNGQASEMPWFDPLLRVVTSKADSFHINGVLWFFPCLIVIFLAEITFFTRLKITVSLFFSIFVYIIYLGVIYPVHGRLPWSVDSAIAGMLFFQLGKYIKSTEILNRCIFEKKTFNLSFLLILLPVFYFLAIYNGRVDMRELNFGFNSIFYPIIAVIGIAIVFLISKLLGQNLLLQKLALSSIVIFPLHLIFFRFLQKFESKTLADDSLLYTLLPYINTFVAILLCKYVFYYLKKNAPRAIGL
ncbi:MULTISPECIES: acyltransferase family protein [Pseudoalteromonas]|uniref:acyltransferase family protein n=1 Tax=Pseudoalteromonas TaxID=53246 RepID=UPI000421725B|nr:MULTISPECIES: acyltransferase family protein [Pseudoalteromonas]